MVKSRQAAHAFSGEGARLYGGRWNHRGMPVVYAADSLALAALEQFVHLPGSRFALSFVRFRLEIPDGVVEVVEPGELPRNWRQEPPPDETKDVGTAWAKRATSAALRVPSAIVPVENDYVLNPFHPDFPRIRVSKPEPFGFDPRMWKWPGWRPGDVDADVVGEGDAPRPAPGPSTFPDLPEPSALWPLTGPSAGRRAAGGGRPGLVLGLGPRRTGLGPRARARVWVFGWRVSSLGPRPPARVVCGRRRAPVAARKLDAPGP